MRRLLPEPSEELTEDDLLGAYAVPDGPDRHVRVNFVESADGAGSLDGLSGGLSSAPDKRIFRLLRDLADVVLVGAGTVRAEGYGYPEYPLHRQERRRSLGRASLPTFAVVSGRLDLDLTSTLFDGPPVRTVVLTTAAAHPGRRAALEAVAHVVTVGKDRVDLAAALDALAGRGLRRVLCEGGPTLLAALAARRLLDEACLTVAPLLAGPGAGRITTGQPHRPLPLRLLHLLTEDDSLFLRYAVEPGVDQE